MIDGLTYIENFLSEDQEKELITNIDNQSWRNDLTRRVQHYGYRYDYTKRKVDSSMFLGALPLFLDDLKYKLFPIFFDREPDQAIVNEYLPGQGIGKHVDCVPCFGPVVASVSLISPVLMKFEKNNQIEELWLEPRSALVLKNEARYRWTHSIAGRKEDNYNNQVITRSRRISVTFRTVILS